MSRECDFDYCFELDPDVVTKIFAVRRLDQIHQAAMIALYSLDAQGLFEEWPRYLHRYLLCPEGDCAGVLEVLVECGLLRKVGERIELVHRPASYPKAKGTVETWAEMSGESVEEFKRSVENRKSGYSYSQPVPKICADTGIGS